MADEYEKNMVNFIKDVRKDLGAPNLPFVIGGSGFGGWEQKVARRLKISAAQKAAAEREEFKGNVLYVETRWFFRPREVSPTGFGYHWNCNAETYYLIGEGMGKAMVELLGGNQVTMKLLKIPAGKFLMGSPQDEEGRRSDEGPQHEVTISKPFSPERRPPGNPHDDG
jgi:formylglycine-generating enzyme required for sulfatase activity